MEQTVKIDFLTAGCNNETGIFDEMDGFILYASGRNVLVSRVLPDAIDGSRPVTCALPQAPNGRVHSCQWVKVDGQLGALVASEDGFLRFYKCRNDYENAQLHYTSWSLSSTINLGSAVTLTSWTLSSDSNYFITASTVKGEIFLINPVEGSHRLVRSYAPKKITALSIGILPNSSDPFILAAPSDSIIRVLSPDTLSEDWKEELTLAGHQNWITSLSVSSENQDVNILSSSLDKTIRVWKIQEKSTEETLSKLPVLNELVPQKNCFVAASNNKKYLVVSDSLALGHENAVFFARFLQDATDGSLQILSGSSDRSLILWGRGFGGAWRTVLQLGDLNGSLGTIGTDHTFAFYGGSFYKGQWIVAAASTGSILFWKRIGNEWTPQIPITGHTDRVESISWSPEGSSTVFLASTSKDQSTRIFAPSTSTSSCYREIARPQIHGYDLKCIAMSCHLNNGVEVFELISGADEKVIRTFQAPKQFYLKLGMNFDESVPESAELPALGLSNKIQTQTNSEGQDCAAAPPSENEGDLVRNSLWPETDKLYGHNQEISALTLSSNGQFLATSAKSHLAADAALRLWKRENFDSKWICSAVVPAHNLTVSALSFSPNSRYLLSVSRDRNLCLTLPESGEIVCKQEAHSRIILGADWVDNDSFLTGSRDKTVKYWKFTGSSVILLQTINLQNGITFLSSKNSSILAIGDEMGNIFIYKLSENVWTPHEISILGGGGLGPADSITDLKWNNCSSEALQLAVASADNSIRILSFYL